MNRLRLALLNGLCGLVWIPAKVRVRLYRALGISVGYGSGVMSGVFIGGGKVSIGVGCFINRFVRFDDGAPITIEDAVHIAHGATFLTSSHEIGDGDCRAAHITYAPVVIGKGAWIGANATILPGVNVGPGCIIAAGAVVTADTKPDSLYAGVPAVFKRDL